MRAILISFLSILGFIILVNIASAGITVTDAEAIYEANLANATIPIDPHPVKTIFTYDMGAVLKQSLSSMSVQTEPLSIKELFIIKEEVTFDTYLHTVSIQTKPLPIKRIFSINEEAAFDADLCTVSIHTELSPVKEMFIHLEEAETCKDLIFPRKLLNDVTPPIITNITISDTTVNSATIKWNTDEVTYSLVKYGKVSVSYTENKGDPLFLLNHTILLTGLQSGTTYYFVVNSADQSENSAQSTEFSFTTVSGIKGDLNSDGILTPADAAIALQLAATGADDPAADVSGDDRVTSLDALMILQAAAGNIEL